MQFWSSLTVSEPKTMNFCGLETFDAELMESKCTDTCCPQYFSFPCFSHSTIRNVPVLESPVLSFKKWIYVSVLELLWKQYQCAYYKKQSRIL